MAMPLTLVPSPRGEGGVREVIDPFGGRADLKRKIVRAVSRKAFQDDPLRLLRAYRMAGQFGFALEPRTARWIAADRERLSVRTPSRPVARERVREELLRLLSQHPCAPALWDMDRSGLLTVILPDLEAGRRVGLAYYGKGGVVKHHLQSVANVEWLLERLASGGLAFVASRDVSSRIQD